MLALCHLVLLACITVARASVVRTDHVRQERAVQLPTPTEVRAPLSVRASRLVWTNVKFSDIVGFLLVSNTRVLYSVVISDSCNKVYLPYGRFFVGKD